MANRVPLIVDTSTLNIKELPAGDSLDLTNSGIVNAGVITASSFSGTIEGIGIRTEGSATGFGVTYLDFRGAGISTFTAAAGIATLNITGGGGGGGLNVLSFFFG